MMKDNLRHTLRERRKAYVIERESAFPFPSDLLGLTVQGMVVGGYSSTKWEPNLSLWWRKLLDSGVLISMPYLANREASMEFRGWNGTVPLERAAFGFNQPNAESGISYPDVVIVPLIGFDRIGNRLGQGAGHYDKYFSQYSRGLKIGIGWSCQELPSVPIDRWDVPLDIIITEREWINCSAERANKC